MNEKQIMVIVEIMPWMIGVLVFFLIFSIVVNFHPTQYVVKTYERINNRLKEQKNGLFDYENTRLFLISNGATFHLGHWINPISYIMMRVLCSLGAFFLGIQFQWYLAVIFAVMGFLFPEYYLIRANKRDNEKLLSQVQTMYITLMVQIKAGVYITDALSECYQNFEKGRLRDALEEMTAEFYINKSFDDVINHFNEKFNNTYIDSLCVILIQAQETGQAVELLGDMSEQLKDMKSAKLLHKKEALDRTITFCLLGMIAAILGVIIYACVTEMFGTVTGGL